jgi:hypothetical protein
VIQADHCEQHAAIACASRSATVPASRSGKPSARSASRKPQHGADTLPALRALIERA